ncbi:CGNR zinc finger domain-containing protein [Vulcanimicrobium alpinum]|uniref:CGNR zinc finger domain-containing protein n=1 Tax=Vulcanimicrobium alpinum TaxID=3016050 RepID=UPI00295E6FB9|nr:ABATE domain-containing protein [Vulcanimicrobium alpinum]
MVRNLILGYTTWAVELESSAGSPDFPLHHGRLSLSFAGTVADRGSAMTERVPTPALLSAWLRHAGLAAEEREPTRALYRRALRLREAIARAVSALVDGNRPSAEDVATLNDAARRWSSRPSLDVQTLTLSSSHPETIESGLGRIAADAIELLADPQERARLRRCGLDSCGAIFLTPAGHRERRWCSMARCGNRAKVTAFRKRAKSR